MNLVSLFTIGSTGPVPTIGADQPLLLSFIVSWWNLDLMAIADYFAVHPT